MKRFSCAFAVISLWSLLGQYEARAGGPLQCDVFVSDSNSLCVASTLIYGKTEAILVDVQWKLSEASKLADRVAATGRKLKAIVISHPDDDHYVCMGYFKSRFPETPIYMSKNGLEVFGLNGMKYFKYFKTNFPAETPDTLPTPELLPSNRLTVDGEEVELVTDLQGDVWSPSNTCLWIPSSKTLVTGDIVFNGVYPWLANSNRTSRAGWLKTLDRIEKFHARFVIAGHKWNDQVPDSPDAIAATRAYIKAFDAEIDHAKGSEDLMNTMRKRFPALSLQVILMRAAKAAIPD